MECSAEYALALSPYSQAMRGDRAITAKVVSCHFRLPHVNLNSRPFTELVYTLHQFGHVVIVLREKGGVICKSQDIRFHPAGVLYSTPLVFQPSQHRIHHYPAKNRGEWAPLAQSSSE